METSKLDECSDEEEPGRINRAPVIVDNEDASARASWQAAVDLARDCGWQEVVVEDWKRSREVGSPQLFELTRYVRYLLNEGR